jgi:Mrp family chromosome partitioning ATPase
MTRIFDALRKSRPFGAPPAQTPAPAAPAAPRLQPPLSAPVALAPSAAALPVRPLRPAPALVGLPALPPLGDDLLREMGTLRVHLESALTEHVPRIVMLVSAQGGEGTTTVATQFAAALARDATLRVLLIDAHARRPLLTEWITSGSAQRRLFGGKRKPSGPAPDPAMSERLRVLMLPEEFRIAGATQPAMRQILDSVESGFDWIIVDGSPVLESPDAASLGGAAAGVVMVVQAGRTKRPVLSRSVDLLRKAGARVLGTVLNRRRLEIPGFIYRRI